MPAAGGATRLGSLPCSKEVLPIGTQANDAEPTGAGPGGNVGQRLACHDLLETFRDGGVERVFVLLRQSKWDIPASLGDGSAFGLNLAYVVIEPTPGIPFTLDRAYPWASESDVALGFPDILLRPRDLLLRLRSHHDHVACDCSLLLLPCERPTASDLVEIDERGRVLAIDIKPREARAGWMWVLALWTPRFTEFLHEWVQRPDSMAPHGREPFPSDVLLAAIDHGLTVTGMAVPEARPLDIGTPETLSRALARGGTLA
jgi:glucose-1-phosphate thymidylyltransferase